VAHPGGEQDRAGEGPAIVGLRKLCVRFLADALRHAIRGPIPVRKRSASPRGTIHWLNQGGPTLTFCPPTASVIIG